MTSKPCSSRPRAQILAQALKGLAGMQGHFQILGIRQPVQVGPKKIDAFAGHGLDRLVHALRVLGSQGLTKPLQGLVLS